ncbi:MAG TPA: hypothetical protein ENJ32_06975 [Crenotrichaceae bacterium]|nr:hypothetical protein [Crenotrichaceae bacterium]
MNQSLFRTGLRNFISSYPSIYFTLANSADSRFINSETELVIEGFPRCGNSFAEAAFRVAQSKEVKIAHHSHASAQVIRAHQQKVPCIVVFRQPDSAVTSLIHKYPSNTTTIHQALRQYIRFYRDVLAYKDSFILTSFEAVTNNFGLAIDLLNNKFDTNYNRFEHTEKNVKLAFDLVDQFTRKRTGKTATDYSPNQSSSAELVTRKKALEKIKHDVETQEKKSLNEANLVYQQLMAVQDC